ncbi:superoxide dismutase [Candidatus Azambacteria bacterium RIFCSPHIGHO2_01_FULL_40_24]|uniref:Superoxide dismutase n=1 Tax=Candidatus Azambacteria bacterium RIFCSPHIGHO2_01_FULL_40_24 TaxID=1797301 RepID=A0A1F5B542_9BACT|nr:MAG: superoxide dismutase [Candidatus Azambacteria bacterium RIFCSPHIGHO2_01_FULL_40_24]
MKHVLPQLSYAYNALEPYIDAQTMEIHHGKHHQAYIDKLNAVLEKYPALADRKLEDLIKNLPSLEMEEGDRTALKNNGGGHLNHSFFWEIMAPKKEIDEKLYEEIKTTFGSLEEFKKIFGNTAATHFGSGWAWLVHDEQNKLQIYSLPNHDFPYLKGHQPVIVLDLWEHAYYLKYQNRRAEYIENWWNVLKLL